jgi:hypothetical protein
MPLNYAHTINTTVYLEAIEAPGITVSNSFSTYVSLICA